MNRTDPDKCVPIRLFWLYLLMITALAAGMRLYHLDRYSLWEDELFTVRSSNSLDQGQISKRLGYVPSAISIMAHGVDLSQLDSEHIAKWRSLGVTEWSIRLGPSVVGIASIFLLGMASRKLLGDRATLIAALLLAVSPWHLFWSQAGRFYSLQFLCYNLALVWYLRSCLEQSIRLAAQASIAVVLAYLSQPPALVICAVLFADVVLCLVKRETIGLPKTGWLFGIVAVLLCLGIQYYDMVGENLQDWEHWGSLQGHNWKVIGASMVLRNHPVLIAVAGLTMLGLIRKLPRLTLYLAMGAVLPVLAFMALSLKESMYVHERYCFIVHYAWIALAALGLSAGWGAIRPHWGTLLAGAGVAAVVVSLLWTDMGYYPDGYRRRWKEAFEYVQPLRQPGEDIACYSSKGTPIARYYLQTDDVLDFDEFPTTPEKLAELKRPTWLVVPAVSATRGELFEHLNTMTQLKRYYDLRVLQPFTSIRVYYYQPPAAPPTE